jgi:hypothetical protein
MPYLHDGNVPALADVVDSCDRDGRANPLLVRSRIG